MVTFIAFLQGFHWSLPLVIVFGVLILIHLGINFVYKFFHAKYVQLAKHSQILLLDVLYHPVKLLVWLGGFLFLVTLYAEKLFSLGIGKDVVGVLQVGIVFAIAWACYIFSKEGERILVEKWKQDLTTVAFFSKVTLLGIIFLFLLLTLPILGIPIGGLLAFGGIGGVVVGFGAKDALANILGGLMLSIDRPFKIGELILCPDGKLEGHVEAIGWRVTKIRTIEKQVQYVPNSLFSSIIYNNKTRATHYRVLEKFTIRYADFDKVDQILSEGRKYILNRADLDRKEFNYFHLVHFDDSAINLQIRVYVKTSEFKKYMQSLEEILIDIYKIIEKTGAELAYPTRMYYLNEAKKD